MGVDVKRTTYELGAAFTLESSRVSRSNKGGFWILLISEPLGALTDRPRGGLGARKSTVIGCPSKPIFRAHKISQVMEHIPLAKIPLNCFLARTASAIVSNETIACPEERPLRSYYNKPTVSHKEEFINVSPSTNSGKPVEYDSVQPRKSRIR